MCRRRRGASNYRRGHRGQRHGDGSFAPGGVQQIHASFRQQQRMFFLCSVHTIQVRRGPTNPIKCKHRSGSAPAPPHSIQRGASPLRSRKIPHTEKPMTAHSDLPKTANGVYRQSINTNTIHSFSRQGTAPTRFTL